MPNSSTLHVFDRHEVAPLVIGPVTTESLALTLSTVVNTDAADYRFPIITGDPSAQWLKEGDEIPKSEGTASEVTVTPRKIAGLSVISSELADDSSPEAAGTIGLGLARDIARKIDAAYFGPAPAAGSAQPGGLESLTGVQTVAAAPTGLDPFIDALAAAESAGVQISSWVTTPAVAAALAKLTVTSGSKQPLFGTDAANGIQRQVLGLPVVVSPSVVAGTVWGIPTDRVYSVLRNDVQLVVDRSRYLEYDQVAIRAILRVGFGFPQPNAVVKIKQSA